MITEAGKEKQSLVIWILFPSGRGDKLESTLKCIHFNIFIPKNSSHQMLSAKYNLISKYTCSEVK